MKFIIERYHLLIFGLFLAAAVYIRVWAAPLSAGPDVAQFWGFATVFHSHGIDFFRYADGRLPLFTFEGWGYFYPPIWILILGLCLLAAPGSQAIELMADSSWRLAMKVPIIAADIAIGCLIFWAVPGRKWLRLIFAVLWLFHPTAWFESAVFGQFDAIAAALLLASVIMLERGRNRLAFLLAGLAVMTKQHTLLSVALMVVAFARNIDRQQLLKYLGILVGVMIIISIPFLITGNFLPYARSILLSPSAPGYQYSIMYAFNGIGSLVTYLHDIFGWDIEGILHANIPLLIVALAIAAVFVYRKKISPIRAALVGLCLFVAIFYRINYQYLVIVIPLALLIAARTDYWIERIVALGLAMVPAVWVWLSSVSFWFIYLKPWSFETVPMLERLGLAHYGTPDYAYVALALTIMTLCLVYVIGVFWWWRRPLPGFPGTKLKPGSIIVYNNPV